MSYRNALAGLLMLLAAVACTDKKTEENIRSLERRVAALERKQSTGSLAASPAVGQAAGESGAPVISFDQLEYDWGTVEEGVPVEHTYRFANTGTAPLVINKATATCGCTVPTWPKDPIPPGGQGEIKVVFDSRNRLQQQTKYVTITANTVPETTRLKISGVVVPSTK
jgi:hypothetical protein